jgi:hypothetical protein
MDTTIRGHNLRVTVAIALLAVLVLLAVALAYALRPVPTTGHGDASSANRATATDGAQGSIIARDPYIERHAEVVQRFGEDRRSRSTGKRAARPDRQADEVSRDGNSVPLAKHR